jgi:alpha-L-fucosidase 2
LFGLAKTERCCAVTLVLSLSSMLAAQSFVPSGDLLVRFDAPARVFEEAMPTGNGRLGATMYGGVSEERVDLNESSMWSGSAHDSDRLDAAKELPEIRRLLIAGDNVAAEALVNKSFTSADAGSGDPRYGSYEELGELLLSFDGMRDADAREYRRWLDLDGAVATTSFLANGVRYTREVFTSAPDQAIVVHLLASRSRSLSLRVHLGRVERFQTKTVGKADLMMTGALDSGVHNKVGLQYATRVRAFTQGGTIRPAGGNSLLISHADEVTLLVTAATNYRGFAGRHSHDAEFAALQDMRAAAHRTYASLLARHQADYRGYFRRVSLALGGTDTTVEHSAAADRLAAAHGGANDPGLTALYFQFGRYLLISSSRPGGLPANLQGLWAEGIHPGWKGDWHLNVNVQMNYWPAEPTGLGDLTDPLFALMEGLQVPGRHTARSYYGADGWVAHIMTNAWGFTSPGEEASWGSTIIGSAWLCQHIWEHYLYTGDVEFLRRMYPVMKGASEFYLSMLVHEPKHGWLVTAPSNSPENTFYMPDGQKASVCMGPAIDEENLRYLFDATAEAEAKLGMDEDLRAKLIQIRAQLAPIQIGADGRVMEWLEPYREVDPHHRHVSHLWGVYPGGEMDPETTPKLAEAARQSLEVRGDGATGWSLAYKMLLWARLGDGDHAYTLLRNLWNPVDPIKQSSAGSFPNLWDAHPPFQIDGNFGATAAIAEMLLDSRPNEVRVLPALPSALPEGKIDGLRAMGGVTVGVTWKAGRMTELRILSEHDGVVRVRYGSVIRELQMKAGAREVLDESLRTVGW